jgi:hypothetical protein
MPRNQAMQDMEKDSGTVRTALFSRFRKCEME